MLFVCSDFQSLFTLQDKDITAGKVHSIVNGTGIGTFTDGVC